MPRPFEHADGFLACIRQLNGWVGEQALRRYQVDLLRREDFTLVSPFDGRRWPLQSSLLLTSDQIAYAFDDGRFYLLVGAQHEGYPLALAFDRRGQRWWRLPAEGPMQAVDAVALAGLASAIERVQGLADEDSRVHALFGDGNFAHLIWNGLPAVAALQNMEFDRCAVEFVSRCDPLGRPRDLVEGIDDLRISGWDERPELHHGRRFRHCALLGAQYLPADLAAAVVARCHAQASADCQRQRARIRADGRKVVWLSLRSRRRDCLNQVDFLSELIVELDRRRSLILLIDGFSFPDCVCPEFFDDYRRRVDAAFAQLQQRCPPLASALARGDALLLNGGSLFDAISLASLAHFYVCHGGTQQHKIGWLYSTPGVVHLPNPSPGVAAWYAAHSAIARPPQCIPTELVEVADEPELSLQERSYRIEVAPAVQFTLAQAAPVLGFAV